MARTANYHKKLTKHLEKAIEHVKHAHEAAKSATKKPEVKKKPKAK